MATAPRNEIAAETNVSWARITPDDDPGHVGLTKLVRDRAEPDLRELSDEQVGREHDQRR